MKLITTYKQDVQTVLDQYLGPKPAKEAAKAINEVLARVASETQLQMLEGFEAAMDKLRPPDAPKPKRKPATAKPKPVKAAANPKAEPKPAPKKGSKKVSEGAANSQKTIKEVYWALVRHFKKESREGDKELLQANPEITKEQKAGAKNRAEQLLAKAAEKAKPAPKPKKDKDKPKVNGATAPTLAVDADDPTAALGL